MSDSFKWQKEGNFKYDIGVVGGAGHIGLPLSIVFADSGFRTAVYDINSDAIDQICAGHVPFMEEGVSELLKSVLKSGNLEIYNTPNCISY